MVKVHASIKAQQLCMNNYTITFMFLNFRINGNNFDNLIIYKCKQPLN